VKKGFVLRKRKVYLLSREERGEVCKFIEEQLRKGYIKLLNLLQMPPVFLWRRRMVKSIWFRAINIEMNRLLRIITLYL